MKARLILSNGMIFEGESIGAQNTLFGEIVFNTSMAGYQEILTDPSCASQVIVMTYPEIGNYGINDDDFESPKVHARGVIIKNYCEKESHYKSNKTLSELLKKNFVVGVTGIDTRKLTQVITEEGTMNCVITTENISDKLLCELDRYETSKELVSLVTAKTTQVFRSEKNKAVKLALIDLGARQSNIDYLKKLGCDLTVYPANVTSAEILGGNFDAAIFSSGPGNPQDASCVIKTAKDLLGKLPLYGICLGNLILALALGAKVKKLKHGHRGVNHPVVNTETNKVFLTAQTHGYTIDELALPNGVFAVYKNLNDTTVEGIKCPKLKLEGVQFNPELANGIFENWIAQIEKEVELCQKIYK